MLSDHSLLKAKDEKGKINVAFDIDGVLSFYSNRLSKTSIGLIEKYGCIISAAGLDHHVSPGAIELMKLLFALPYVRVSFYSSGDKARNIEFVEKLLTRALGAERYLAVKDDVVVLSKGDVVKYGHDQNQTDITQLCSSLAGISKKDLTKILRPQDSMDAAILVDDDPACTCLGQHKNILVCPEVHDDCYFKLSDGNCDLPHKNDNGSYEGINNIFYVTGLLMKLISNHMTHTKSITDALFELNYITYDAHWKNELLEYERGAYICEPIPHPYHSDLVSCWHELMLEKHYYESGLELLRKFNPDLTLIDSQLYHSCKQAAKVKI